MSLHSKSFIAFGKLLTEVSDYIYEGKAIGELLSRVRGFFEGSGVVLTLERPYAPLKTYYDRDLELDVAALGFEQPAQYLDTQADEFVSLRLSESDHDKRSTLKMILYRAQTMGDFDADEVEMAKLILSQISRLMQLSARLNNQRVEVDLYTEALESMQVGVVLLAADGKMHTLSSAARQMLTCREGMVLSGGRLRALDPREDRALQAAIAAVCAGGDDVPLSRGLALTKRSGNRSLGVMIRRVPMVKGSGAQVAVYIRDSDAMPEFQSEWVRQIFDLTPAEAAVTNRLTAGLSLEDAANALSISRNTARAHLRSIFMKNGISRQTELVRLVLNSAVLFGEVKSTSAAR